MPCCRAARGHRPYARRQRRPRVSRDATRPIMMRLPGVGAGCQDAAGEPQHVRRGQGQHETRLTGRSLATSSSHSEATRGLRRRTAASGIDRVQNGPPGRPLRMSGGVYAPLTAPHVLASVACVAARTRMRATGPRREPGDKQWDRIVRRASETAPMPMRAFDPSVSRGRRRVRNRRQRALGRGRGTRAGSLPCPTRHDARTRVRAGAAPDAASFSCVPRWPELSVVLVGSTHVCGHPPTARGARDAPWLSVPRPGRAVRPPEIACRQNNAHPGARTDTIRGVTQQ